MMKLRIYKALLAIPFLLIGIGSLLILIIWNQYRIEKKNMKAFIKIPSQEVKIIKNRLLKFQNDLLNQETFEKKWASKIPHDLQDRLKINPISAYSRRSETQHIKYTEFRKRYYKYVLRVILCISALVTITICDLIITRQAIDVIYNRQAQVQFASKISNRASLAYVGICSVLMTNDSLIVEHQPAINITGLLVDELREIQSEIPQRFLEVDGTYDPDVKEILFGNNVACTDFVARFVSYCKSLLDQGFHVNLMTQTSGLQTILFGKYHWWNTLNRTSKQELSDVNQANTSNLLANFAMTAQQAQRVVNFMHKSMTNKISEMQNSRRIIIIIFSISLFVVGFLIWIYILKVIREVYNNFKKVLQLFPPNLILSSYLLKQFLQKTSSGILLR